MRLYGNERSFGCMDVCMDGTRSIEKMPVELCVRIVGKREYGYCIFMIERWDEIK